MEVNQWKQVLSPYKLSICLLLRECVLIKGKAGISAKECEGVHLVFMKLMEWINSDPKSLIEPTLPILKTEFQELGVVPELLCKSVSDMIYSIESPDDIYDLFDSLSSFLSSTLVERSSLFGLYLRKVMVAYTSSHFDGICWLFDIIPSFKEGSLEFPIQDASSWILSKLEGEVSNDKIPVSQMSSMKSFILPPALYYMNYFSAMENCDYQLAIDNLHRYFDTLGPDSTPSFALFHLALLYFRFGKMDLSLESLMECIIVSQSLNQAESLVHALSLLVRMTAASGHVTEARDLLIKCNALVKDSNSVALQTCLDLAIYCVQTAADASPWLTHAKTVMLTNDINPHDSRTFSQVQSQAWSLWGSKYLSQLYLEPCSRSLDITSFSLEDLSAVKNISELLRFHVWNQDVSAYSFYPSNSQTGLEKCSFYFNLVVSSFEKCFIQEDQQGMEHFLMLVHSYTPAHLLDSSFEKLTACLCDAKYAFFQNNFPKVLSICNDILDRLSSRQYLKLPVFLLIHKTHACLNNYGLCLEPLLNAISIAEELSFTNWQAILSVYLADWNKNLELLFKWKNYIISNGTPWQIRDYYLTYVKISQMETTNEEKINTLILARTSNLEIGNRRVDREICYLLAMLFNETGDIPKRDEYSGYFESFDNSDHRSLVV